MKIYTKRGDAGQTDLFGGARVSKANPRVIAYGAVDAANSALGFVAASGDIFEPLSVELPKIMSDLFDLGAELATVPKKADKTAFLSVERVTHLEQLIDQSEAEVPELKNFVLPTGCDLAARLHMARTAVRCAEQEVISLHDSGEQVRAEIIQYLNRLSDLCFSWARWANIKSGTKEVLWVKN
ncbi:MAG: cob(I)yrinic acid a,c-diamide adenosyltransferase [Deltaproteobacteria bacterium]|nr:cob(I)yrinic acid a,c-diamide adenosyltransferase [Deltaproteobacteria bacterium]